jgi:hypothetical protein
MQRIFDYYGAKEFDLVRISDLVSEATGIKLEPRESDYIGEYFMAAKSPGNEELKVMSNELEDEQGKFLRWPDYADYKTILTAELVMPADAEAPYFLDNLREKLRRVDDLVFLRRTRPSRRTPQSSA